MRDLPSGPPRLRERDAKHIFIEKLAITYTVNSPYTVDNSYQILAYIVLSTAVIFYIDIITPLGFLIGILYFIPLFLTVYLKRRDAPFLSAGIFILLIFAGFLLSPRDISDVSVLFAFFDRLFLSAMLIISSVFIRSYSRNQEDLRLNEERYRSLTEWSPDAILVCREGKILYTNPAGLKLFGADEKEKMIGRNILDLVDPADRDIVGQRTGQTMLGARMLLDKIGISRPDGTVFQVQATAGRIIWNGDPAIQIHLREIPPR